MINDSAFVFPYFSMITDASTPREIYTECATYDALFEHRQLKNVEKLIACIYTYKSNHRTTVTTLDEAFTAHRNLTLGGRRRGPRAQQRSAPVSSPPPDPRRLSDQSLISAVVDRVEERVRQHPISAPIPVQPPAPQPAREYVPAYGEIDNDFDYNADEVQEVPRSPAVNPIPSPSLHSSSISSSLSSSLASSIFSFHTGLLSSSSDVRPPHRDQSSCSNCGSLQSRLDNANELHRLEKQQEERERRRLVRELDDVTLRCGDLELEVRQLKHQLETQVVPYCPPQAYSKLQELTVSHARLCDAYIILEDKLQTTTSEMTALDKQVATQEGIIAHLRKALLRRYNEGHEKKSTQKKRRRRSPSPSSSSSSSSSDASSYDSDSGDHGDNDSGYSSPAKRKKSTYGRTESAKKRSKRMRLERPRNKLNQFQPTFDVDTKDFLRDGTEEHKKALEWLNAAPVQALKSLVYQCYRGPYGKRGRKKAKAEFAINKDSCDQWMVCLDQRHTAELRERIQALYIRRLTPEKRELLLSSVHHPPYKAALEGVFNGEEFPSDLLWKVEVEKAATKEWKRSADAKRHRNAIQKRSDTKRKRKMKARGKQQENTDDKDDGPPLESVEKAMELKDEEKNEKEDNEDEKDDKEDEKEDVEEEEPEPVTPVRKRRKYISEVEKLLLDLHQSPASASTNKDNKDNKDSKDKKEEEITIARQFYHLIDEPEWEADQTDEVYSAYRKLHPRVKYTAGDVAPFMEKWLRSMKAKDGGEVI